MTNADRIRNMSDKELAKFLAFNAHCEECCWQITVYQMEVASKSILNGFNQKRNRREI